MKKLPAFFFILFISSALLAQVKGKRIYATKNGDNGCLFTAGPQYGPGDTIVVRASLNPWSYIYLGGISGTADKPVVVINEGPVELNSGFDIDNCRYLKLTGSGTKEKYGFRVQHSGGVAVGIHGKSAHIEVERFYAEDCSFGCWIKNEANCDTSINNWVLNYISVHDYELHNMKIEGFYMGSTDPNNQSRPVDCKGAKEFYKPSKLGNIKIYNGIINGTGRPAIQLANAQVGMSEIYNNVISNVGREFNDQQGTGISLGMYTRAYVHHNSIKNTYTWGIASLGGSGLIRIENNTVDSSGYLDGKKLDWPQNIAVDTRHTDPVDSTKFIIVNNIVDHPGRSSKNIEVWKTFATYSTENIICNNKTSGKADLSLSVAPGIRWSNCGVLQQNSETSNSSRFFLFGIAIPVLLVFIFLLVRRRSRKRQATSGELQATS